MINRFLAFQQSRPILVSVIVLSLVISCLLLTAVITWNIKPDLPSEVEVVVETVEVSKVETVVVTKLVTATPLATNTPTQTTDPQLLALHTQVALQQQLLNEALSQLGASTLTPAVPTPLPTTIVDHTICVVEDNSGMGHDYQGRLVGEIEDYYGGREDVQVFGFSSYDDEFEGTKCHVIVADFTIEDGSNGPAALLKYRANHRVEPNVIGHALDGWVETLHVETGLIQTIIRKPSTKGVVEQINQWIK